MINKFLGSRAGIIIISCIWGLGLATLFKKSCDNGPNCRVIEYRGPNTEEASGHWNYGGKRCYKLKPYIVNCRTRKAKGEQIL